MDSMFESENEIAPDILFTHCGGKSRMKVVVEALRALNVAIFPESRSYQHSEDSLMQ
jgi:hypothetical protein